MTTLTKYGANMAQASFDNPTADEVIKTINEMDGKKWLSIRLKTILKYLNIRISEQKFRMHISHTVLNETGSMLSSRIILDSTQQSDEKLSFLLENGQVDDIPIAETMTRQSALDIALYFLEHGDMPDGLTWEPPLDHT